ncbi:MAG: ABC transporter ATP-binding protein [Burkholderiaceae bacterium]
MTAHGETLLRADGISRHFGGNVAVSKLSFEIRSGEIVGLIGPNGAGKSTTFNVISGFLAPTTGRLSFLGRDITSSSATVISRMGLVRTFQHNSLLSDMSVYDNLLVAAMQQLGSKTARDARVRETASLTNLDDCLHDLAGSLPHGRQRMLSIAIAMTTRPRLLCLDEPLTGLQGQEVARALALFEQLRSEQGVTILLVEHNMRAVMRVCDRILVLDHGELLAEGTPAEVSANQAVIDAYLGAPK